jgi:hypothetical protein
MTTRLTQKTFHNFAYHEVRLLILSKPELASFDHQINGPQSPRSNGPDLLFAYRDLAFREVGRLRTSLLPISKLPTSFTSDRWSEASHAPMVSDLLHELEDFAFHDFGSWLPSSFRLPIFEFPKSSRIRSTVLNSP